MDYKVRFFDYPLQFKDREADYMRIVGDTLSKGAFILGEELERFEDEFGSFLDSAYVIGVGNCTDALLLSLYASGIGQGGEVITVSHSLVATVEVIKLLGAVPVFVDIADDHNMDVDGVEEKITEKTKAIVPVQLNGRICSKMDKLVEIAARHGLVIIEDAAQAIGAKFKGKCAGKFGKTGCFSFYPAKILGAFGDAGAVVTDDPELASRLKMLRNHGRSEQGEVEAWGLNSRMDNVQAAILSYKLSFIQDMVDRRRAIAALYDEGLSDIKELCLPPPPAIDGHHFDVFQNYEVEADDRDGLASYLQEAGIETNLPWGGKGVHQFEALGLEEVSLPRTEEFFERALMLPMHPGLEDAQIEYIVETTRSFYRKQ